MLLDGQQRLTTPYVLFKGKAPRFYEGESLFFDLHFNRQTQEFRFWQKSQMQNNPAWIGVHEFLQEGLAALLERLEQLDEERRTIVGQNLSRLSRLDQVRDYTYTVDQVSGDHYPASFMRGPRTVIRSPDQSCRAGRHASGQCFGRGSVVVDWLRLADGSKRGLLDDTAPQSGLGRRVGGSGSWVR